MTMTLTLKTAAAIGIGAALFAGGGLAAANASPDGGEETPTSSAGGIGPMADLDIPDAPDGRSVVVTESTASTDGWVEVLPDGSTRPLEGTPPLEGPILDEFTALADELAAAGAVPAGTTAEDVAEWLLSGLPDLPFDSSDPAIAEILAHHGVIVAQ